MSATPHFEHVFSLEQGLTLSKTERFIPANHKWPQHQSYSSTTHQQVPLVRKRSNKCRENTLKDQTLMGRWRAESFQDGPWNDLLRVGKLSIEKNGGGHERKSDEAVKHEGKPSDNWSVVTNSGYE